MASETNANQITGYYWPTCPKCGMYLSIGHACPTDAWWNYTTTTNKLEPEMPKQHMTIRLPGDIVDSVEVMASYRKEDKTTLVTKMLRFALAQKQGSCEHEQTEDRICVACGRHFPEPTDDF